jgi:hypothetical protein
MPDMKTETENRPSRSRFGGLWIGQRDRAAVERQIAEISDPALRERVIEFDRDGYTILRGAVSAAAIDRYLAEYEIAIAIDDRIRISLPFKPENETVEPEKVIVPGAKILDTAMLLRTGDSLSFAPVMVPFLQAMFGEPALGFQSLHFDAGSTQAIHQDTAYVVVDQEPMKLVASWIALEDVEPGSGELIYFTGGHRMTEYSYDQGKSKHFNLERDGHAPHHAHLEYLKDEAARRGLEQSSFLAKKGDVLFWHADLPHGGGAITRPNATRRSLVTHYCPASQVPFYFRFLSPDRQRKARAPSGNFFSSMIYPPSQFAYSPA